MTQATLPLPNTSTNIPTKNIEFYAQISNDITQVLIQLVSERGHGKSTALKTIVDYCLKQHDNLVFKCMDVSQSWYHCAPLKYRQRVTMEKIEKRQVANIGNCVYELGELPNEVRRAFVATIMKQDWEKRYAIKLDNPEELEKQPWIVYILEESNVYFNSYSFRASDSFTPVLQDFVSVGRNYRLSSFLVATVEESEIAPHLRRRTRKIYGRVEAASDLAKIRRRDKNRETKVAPMVLNMPRFSFLYDTGRDVYGPVRVPDSVRNVPEDYEITVSEVEVVPVQVPWRWITLGVTVFLLILWLFG